MKISVYTLGQFLELEYFGFSYDNIQNEIECL